MLDNIIIVIRAWTRHNKSEYVTNRFLFARRRGESSIILDMWYIYSRIFKRYLVYYDSVFRSQTFSWQTMRVSIIVSSKVSSNLTHTFWQHEKAICRANRVQAALRLYYIFEYYCLQIAQHAGVIMIFQTRTTQLF